VLPSLTHLRQNDEVSCAERRIRVRGVVRVNQLREPQSTSHPRRSAADDHHVGRHLRPLYTFDRFAENQHLDFAFRLATQSNRHH